MTICRFRSVVIVPLFLFIIIISGCTSVEKKVPTLEYSHFVFVTPCAGATFESLAVDYLGDARFASRIKEFNGLDTLNSGQEIIIPLQDFRPGGLTAKGYQVVPVLAYHHFSYTNSSKKMVVNVRKFESQLRYLEANGYTGITLNQFRSYLEFGQVPEKSILLTIDDGWESAYSIAYPLLLKYGYSAVLFIPTSSIREEKTRLLSWNQLRMMVQNKVVEIQAHTKSHRNLTKSRKGESFSSYVRAIKSEIDGAKHIIMEKLGSEANSLSYPYGATNVFVNALVELEGYTTAFTVKRGGVAFFQNNFQLNRSMIYGGYSEKKFAKNVKTFEPYALISAEPVDESLNLAELDYQNPIVYENNKQWRTAFIAWKLNRDWLVSEFRKKENQRAGLSEQIKNAENKIIELDERLKNIANNHFHSALDTTKKAVRRKLLLITLLYDPEHNDALNHLKGINGELEKIEYTVKAGDSFKSVAKSVYRDRRKAVLIPIFNLQAKNESDLIPGSILTLPKLTKQVQRPAQEKSAIKGACQPDKPNVELSKEHYLSAVQQFDNDQISKALSSLKKALCADSGNQEAQEMQRLLESL